MCNVFSPSTYMDNDDQISIYTNCTNYNDVFAVVYSSNTSDIENTVLLIVGNLWHSQESRAMP